MAARAVRRGPLCSCPRVTPPHPICCPKSRTGIKRSANASTGKRLQKKRRLTLKTTTAQTNISDNLHARRNVCLFACFASCSLPFTQPLVPCQGPATRPGRMGHRAGGGAPAAPARLPAAGRHNGSPAGENREVCRRRGKFGATEDESKRPCPASAAGRAGRGAACLHRRLSFP